MNTTLLLANAIALAVLVSFQFVPEHATQKPLAQRMPHYLQVQKAPQLAVLNDQDTSTPQAVSNSEQVRPALTSEHLVFETSSGVKHVQVSCGISDPRSIEWRCAFIAVRGR